MADFIHLEGGLTLHEALEIAYADDDDAIYIEPPDAGVLTDQDSGDKDGGSTIDNLPGAKLRANAEVVLRGTDRDEILVSPQNVTDIKLISGDLEHTHNNFIQPNYEMYKNLSCVEIFELFFDEDMMKFLVEQSSRYASFTNCQDPKISIDEMKCFLAILIISGYNALPGKRYYWDSESDMRNNIIYNSMRRDRFLQIFRFLHFADNSKQDLTDKIWKMRPLMDKIKAKFLQHFQPEEDLCYDESMVKYYGRHGCKQFIRGKPIRFGYKMWSLNTKSGYLLNFEMYQGNNPRRNVQYEKEFGKAAAPLVTIYLQNEVNQILCDRGLELRKWLCNQPEMYAEFQVSKNFDSSIIQLGKHKANKTLGICWNATDNVVQCDVKDVPEE
ncbi:transposase is4 [Holotrichia oblita]|uniref:Transposase is4 n=1 Tax=Holotrichia oblita TaxID=644536 RepID=A0ACB9T3Y8_HOLOL|nr:transposase is4 [Holotrichia oblita]